MSTRLVLSITLSLLALACGSSSSDPDETSGGSSSSGSQEPIVVDVPPETHTGTIVVGTDPCTTDADCVPAACCHAESCIARANAGSCADAMCTADCRANTTDCGGGCLCQDGHCAARLWAMEAPVVQ